MKKAKYFSQTILSEDFLFGKKYFWMQDVDGTIYLVRMDENGYPRLS